MKTVALISGGKDSCFNLMSCIAEGHDVVALANLRPAVKDELDSYMYQTVGHHAIDLYAEALDLPLYTQTIQGSSLATGKDYQPQEGDEVEDLFTLLARIKEELNIEAVSVGAILSDYQRVRVENVCQRLNLVSLAFLWQRNQAELLKEMIDCGVKAILIKVAALGLDMNKHLGLTLAEIYPHMLNMRAKYGLNECGEGGEYETFVLDCPVFKKAIVIDETEKVVHSDDAFAPVGYLNLRKCHLQEKEWDSSLSLREKVLQLPLTTSLKLFSFPTETQGTSPGDTSNNSVQSPHEEFPPMHSTDGQSFQVAGVCPLTRSGEDVSSVATRAMDTLMDCVENRMGHSRKDISSVSLCLHNMADFQSVNTLYKTYFSLNPPVRVCVQACLPPTTPIQLSCQGTVTQEPGQRRVLHVQGLSLWAPANIGPYSQAYWTGGTLHLAGMIALNPATLTLVKAGLADQCRLALTHVGRVLRAVSPTCDLAKCPLVVCYLSKHGHQDGAREVLATVRGELCVSERPVVPFQGSVQCCVVPGLPQGALVEWHVYAWPQTTMEDDFQVTETTQHYDNYTLSLFCIGCKGRPEFFSCRMTLDAKSSTPGPLSISEVVENLKTFYTQHTCTMTGKNLPRMATVFFKSSVFSYFELHQGFQKHPPPGTDKGSQLCISLVPVLGLDTEQQLLAWCQ